MLWTLGQTVREGTPATCDQSTASGPGVKPFLSISSSFRVPRRNSFHVSEFTQDGFLGSVEALGTLGRAGKGRMSAKSVLSAPQGDALDSAWSKFIEGFHRPHRSTIELDFIHPTPRKADSIRLGRGFLYCRKDGRIDGAFVANLNPLVTDDL